MLCEASLKSGAARKERRDANKGLESVFTPLTVGSHLPPPSPTPGSFINVSV